jgi:hypothetical protein
MIPDGDPVEVKPLGGMTSTARLLTYADGTKLVQKDTTVQGLNPSNVDPVAIADAEELGAVVLGALGAPSARVERTGPTELHIEYVEGVTGEIYHNYDGEIESPWLRDGNKGRLIGLADHVMSNHDRHGGNWLFTRDDNLVGIDHGNAFHDDGKPVTGSAFASPLYEQDPASGESKLAARNDFTAADMADARRRLDSVRPEFERTGRTDWHDTMLRRLDDVAQHAAGTRNRLAPRGAGGVEVPQSRSADAAATWPAADHDHAGGWPAADEDHAAAWPTTDDTRETV